MLSHHTLAGLREAGVSYLCQIMLEVTQMEATMASDTQAQLRERTREFSPHVMRTIDELMKQWEGQPRAESVLEAKQWRQATLKSLEELSKSEPDPNAAIMCIVLDVTTTGTGDVVLCKEGDGKGESIVAASGMARKMICVMEKAIERKMTVHLLLLGCQTILLWNCLKHEMGREEARRSMFAGKVFACFTTSKFPSGCVPIVMYTYGRSSSRGTAGSLANHQTETTHLLTEWHRIYEPDAQETEEQDLPPVHERIAWGSFV